MTVEQVKAPDNGAVSTGQGGITVDPRRRLDQLSPLIHELIAWELVYRDESGDFVLHDDVQARLREVSAQRPQSIAQVYVGRQCEVCGVVGVTRLIEGVRTCAVCSRAAKEVDAEPVSEKPVARGRRWHRKAG